MAEDAVLAAIADLKNDFTGMRTDISAVQRDMSGVQRDLAAVQHDLSGVQRDLAGLKVDVGGFRAEQISTRTELMARMDRLQNKMEDFADDLTVDYGAAMQSGRVAESASLEARTLAQTVSAMQRQIRRISAKVFGPDDAH